MNFKQITVTVIATVLTIGGVILAGSLTPSGDTSTPTMYTLSDIYNKLNLNTYSASTHTVSTTTTPTGTMRTLTEIWDKIPTITASTVATGTTILGISGTAKVITGTGTGTIATTTEVLTNYYAYDANGAVIQGAASAGAVTEWYANDTPAGTTAWATGYTTCANLSTAGGSNPGVEWRLPTKTELVAKYNGDHTGFQSGFYWSSTEYPGSSDLAYDVLMMDGHVGYHR